ncbi:MAG: DUF4827 family protein [Dysgonomonas sp.]|nr:DUF4827 family protein [Dysgonomonas sp.]
MKKITCIIFTLISLGFLLSSCGGETYADKLRKSNKAINRFIDQKDIKIINDYPEDGIFAENEYFKEPKTGIYMRVINKGDEDDKPVLGKTDVYLRYTNIINLLKPDDEIYPGNEHGVYMTFRYGYTNTYKVTSTTTTAQTQMYMFLSQACVVPFEYGLGNNSEVSLIVPFENGSTYQGSSYVPLYYESLRYRFTNDVEED